MALIHQATLGPSKLTLLEAWLPNRPWFPGGPGLRQLGAYRFDDPDGEVGVEGFLLDAGGTALHVPLTYRSAPLAGAEDALVGTTEHSVLGTRWVYDAVGDPVWARVLATAVLTGGHEAEQLVETGDGTLSPRGSTATVVGSGARPVVDVPTTDPTWRDDGPTTVVDAGGLELVVVRVVGTQVDAEETLTGRWSDGGPAVLAGVRTLA